MTSSNENDSSPVTNSSASQSNSDSAPLNADGQNTEGGERAERGEHLGRSAVTDLNEHQAPLFLSHDWPPCFENALPKGG